MERKMTAKEQVKKGGISLLEKPQVKPVSVSEAAYSLFEKRGRAHGNDWQDWFEAEKIINKRGK